MKSFAGFVRKEFYHILRDYRTMIILFGMPVAQILIFGYVVRNEIRNVNIAVLDYSKDETTREITQKILSSGYFTLYRNLQDESEIQQVFKQGKVKEVLIFEDGFGKNIKQTGVAKMQITRRCF